MRVHGPACMYVSRGSLRLSSWLEQGGIQSERSAHRSGTSEGVARAAVLAAPLARTPPAEGRPWSRAMAAATCGGVASCHSGARVDAPLCSGAGSTERQSSSRSWTTTHLNRSTDPRDAANPIGDYDMARINQLKHHLANGLWSTMSRLRGMSPNALFVTHQNRIARSQIFPFYYFRSALRSELGVDFREVSLEEYEVHGAPFRDAELVFLQPWWNIERDRLQYLLRRIRDEHASATVVLLDSFAPLDLRLAQHVCEFVDVYVKKQVFRDRSLYGQSTSGDTNLVDYYGKFFDLSYPPTRFVIPADFMAKLLIGPGFASADSMLSKFAKRAYSAGKRPIDLHARLGGSGEDWYGRMRQLARQEVKGLSGVRTASDGAVAKRQYLNELKASKLCFSPFGFGEVCWRDYEAVMCGALLIKPDMSHVETDPDIFQPYRTYVPIKWDFSDLGEKVNIYINDERAREEVAFNAFEVVANYFRTGGFERWVRGMLDPKVLLPIQDPGVLGHGMNT
jgi:hypothetical protein